MPAQPTAGVRRIAKRGGGERSVVDTRCNIGAQSAGRNSDAIYLSPSVLTDSRI